MGISVVEFVHKESPYPATLSPIDMLLRISNEEVRDFILCLGHKFLK